MSELQKEALLLGDIRRLEGDVEKLKAVSEKCKSIPNDAVDSHSVVKCELSTNHMHCVRCSPLTSNCWSPASFARATDSGG